jgi:hypothetical protein
MTRKKKSRLESALTDDNGEWDVGNIGLFALIILVLGVIPFICAMVLTRAVLKAFYSIDFPFDVGPVGLGVGAICGGYATAMGAWGAARRLADNKGAVMKMSSETTPEGDKTTLKVGGGGDDSRASGGDANAP